MKNDWSFGVYLRLSSLEDTSNSINNQRLLINRYLEKNIDIEVYNTYIDEGFTGTNFERPAFKALLEDIKLKRINGVIVKDLSRFGRNYISVGTYIEEFFPTNNIRFISVNDNIDTLEVIKSDNITTSFKNIINELYAKDISEKVKATITYKKLTGKFTSGNTPYGYKLDKNNKYKLIIDKNSKKNIELIFSLYLKGNGVNKIVKILNKKNIPSPSKYKNINLKQKNIYWTNTTVYNILTNNIYCGNLANFKNTHQAIITEKDFNTVKYLLKEKNTPKGDIDKYLFSGFIRCSSCKAFMLIKKSNDSNHEIICSTFARINESLCTSHYITSKILEDLVLIDINKRIKKIFFLKKKLENIKRFLKKNNYLDNNFYKELLKKYIYNANFLKKSYYEKWKLNTISYNEFLVVNNILNRYIFLIETLKKIMLNTSDRLYKYINNINYLQRYIRFSNKALSREMLDLFIEVIYIDEKQKISIIYKKENEFLELLKFVEGFFSD